jgi:hypothetical protein
MCSACYRAVAFLLAASAVTPHVAAGQYRIIAPSGDTIVFTVDTLRRMLDSTRALYADLEEDPRVGYSLGFGEPVDAEEPEQAFPWNAVDVVSDSSAAVVTPGNLREAARAYYNYAVRRMRVVRYEDPDVSCDSVMNLEQGVVSSFIEGWIVARTLFGGPAFTPLDEFVFARQAGHLRPLIAVRGYRSLGVCTAEWAEANGEAMAAYGEWRRTVFPDASEEAEGAATDISDGRSATPEEPGA